MLGEQQLAAWREHAGDLPQRGVRRVNGAQDQRAHDGVDRVVREGQPLRGGVDHRRLKPGSPEAVLEAPAHRRIRLGEDQFLDVVGMVPQVQAAYRHRSRGRIRLPVEAAPSGGGAFL
jgi:hypothetical protein